MATGKAWLLSTGLPAAGDTLRADWLSIPGLKEKGAVERLQFYSYIYIAFTFGNKLWKKEHDGFFKTVRCADRCTIAGTYRSSSSSGSS